MDSEIIKLLIFALIAILSFFAWKKYKDSDYECIMWIAIASMLIDLLKIFVISNFELSPHLSVALSIIWISIWSIFLSVLLKIGLRSLKKR